MRHVAVPALALVAVCAAGALPALAADQAVYARNSAYTPGTVALKPGETLTIAHDDGARPHSLKFGDEAQPRRSAETGWTETRTFGAAEVRDQPYTFSCSLHYGMGGRVYVNDAGTVPAPSPAPTASPSPTTSPLPTPDGSPTPAPTSTPAPAPAPARLRSLGLVRASKRGIVLSIDLSAPAVVRGTLRRRAPGARRFTRAARLRFGTVAAGPRRLRLERRLRRGRYRLELTAAGAERTLRFRVSGR